MQCRKNTISNVNTDPDTSNMKYKIGSTIIQEIRSQIENHRPF